MIMIMRFVVAVMLPVLCRGQASPYYHLKVNENICSTSAAYLAHNNRTCGKAGTLIRYGQNGKNWGKWVIDFKEYLDDGNVVVTLQNKFESSTKSLRCKNGYLTANDKLEISIQQFDANKAPTWILRPLGNGSYEIGTNIDGIRYYLGVNTDCAKLQVQLYKGNAAKSLIVGLSLQILNSSEQPFDLLTAPGAPINLQMLELKTNEDTISYYAVWGDGSEGKPKETYQLQCREYTGNPLPCAPSNEGNDVTVKTVRGASSAVIDLEEDSWFSCVVVASNSRGSACSNEVLVRTPLICADIAHCKEYGADCKCKKCKLPYSVDLQGTCTACAVTIDHCIAYDFACKCKECQLPYAVDLQGTCTACSDTIDFCSAYDFACKCTSCEPRHLSDRDGGCTRCESIENCLEYKTDCSCKTCDVPYAVDRSGTCTNCAAGYALSYIDNTQCVPTCGLSGRRKLLVNNFDCYTESCCDWLEITGATTFCDVNNDDLCVRVG